MVIVRESLMVGMKGVEKHKKYLRGSTLIRHSRKDNFEVVKDYIWNKLNW